MSRKILVLGTDVDRLLTEAFASPQLSAAEAILGTPLMVSPALERSAFVKALLSDDLWRQPILELPAPTPEYFIPLRDLGLPAALLNCRCVPVDGLDERPRPLDRKVLRWLRPLKRHRGRREAAQRRALEALRFDLLTERELTTGRDRGAAFERVLGFRAAHARRWP